MKVRVKKYGMVLLAGMAAFLSLGVSSEAALDTAYQAPALSGPVSTWVYEGESLDAARNRILADDQEDGDLTKAVRVTGNADTSKAGNSFTMNYQVTDADGNTSQMSTQVKVLAKSAADTEKVEQKKLYTLPAADHLTDIGFLRGYYHDRQNLGIYLPADAGMEIRIVNAKEFGQNISWELMNDDQQTEISGTLEADKEGEDSWVTVTNSTGKDSVLFLLTPKNTPVQPIVEFKWNDSVKSVPYYRYGDDEAAFYREWKDSNAPFAIVEGSAATFLVPRKDIDYLPKSTATVQAVAGLKKLFPTKIVEYQFQTLDEMLEWYAAFVKQYDAFAGLDFYAEEPWNQNMRAKFFIKANQHGAGQAYYSPDHSAYNGDNIREYLYKYWLALHEFGHGYEGSIAQQENPFVETTNNIMAAYFENTYRPEGEYGWLLGDFWESDPYPGANDPQSIAQNKVSRYKALGKRAEDRRNSTQTFADIVEGAGHYNVSLFMFVNVLDKAGAQEGTAAMHAAYRKYFYENRRCASSSDIVTEYIGQAGGYNLVPYFDTWHIHPGIRTEARIYDRDLPMVYYLKDLIPSEMEAEAVRAKLGLSGIYALVTTDDLAYTGYQSRVNLNLEIDDLAQIQGKNIVIKNGSVIVKKLPVTGKNMSVELPVGIYEVELPVPRKADYSYGNQYLDAVKGSTAKTFTYERKKGNPVADDTKIQLRGLGDSVACEVNINTEENSLTWKVNGGQPHFYFPGEDYIGVRVRNASGALLYSQTIQGDEEAEALVRKINFPVGSTLEISHKEFRRVKFVSSYTREELSFYNSTAAGEATVTYVMTGQGLMEKNWDAQKQMSVALAALEQYSQAVTEGMTQSDAQDPLKFREEKLAVKLAAARLDDTARAEYEKDYGVLLGQEQQATVRHKKIDTTALTGYADSQHSGEEADKALDGDVTTMWHSDYGDGVKPDIAGGKNNSFTILLDQNRDVEKLVYVPRSEGNNGIILEYRLFYSTTESGDDFREIQLRDHTWANDNTAKSVEFSAPNARRIRICATATAGATADQFISAAEFELYAAYQVAVGNTYLSDLCQMADSTHTQAEVNSGVALMIGGEQRSFAKGISMQAGQCAAWDLTGREMDILSGWAGVSGTGSGYLEVYGDGALLFATDTLTAGDNAEWVNVSLKGVKLLEIKAVGAALNLADVKLGSDTDKTRITLKTGESASVTANTFLIPEDRGAVTWSSSNAEVASVDDRGVVTAKSEGTAVITAVYAGGSLSCTVSVEKRPEAQVKPITGPDDKNNPVVTPEPEEKDPEPAVKKPGKVKLKKVKPGKRKATVTWKKVSGAKGYEVWMRQGKGKYKKVKTLSAKKLTVTVKKLKKGKKYTFRVRAYSKKSSGGKLYGAYSGTKTVKVK